MVKSKRDRKTTLRGGFTLLELLLAAIMAAVLLAVLWNLFSMYVRLFEKGQAKAEQSQLVRALFEQVSDDLHAAIQDPTPGQPLQPRGTVAVRRFGLFGTETELRFDVLQITPFGGSLTPTTDAEPGSTERPPLRAPELRTVYYRFQSAEMLAAATSLSSTDSSGGSGESGQYEQPGLSRRELDFETPLPGEGEAGLSGLGPVATDASQGDFSAGGDGQLLVVDPNDDSVMLAPEVTGCQFRYFDGKTWNSQWDSLGRKSLPVAVEVTLQVSTLDDRQQQLAVETPVLTDEPDALTGAAVAPSTQVYPTYRLVIDIPSAPMHEAPRKVRRTAISRLQERAARRYRPRIAPRNSSTQRQLPDEWLRNQR